MTIPNDLMRLFQMACKSDATVLITGPTGTGKTTLAKQVHEGSKRAQQPFASINLACLHEGTIESELFGHEKGAFTGADRKRIGRLESANGGTVFLDEVGDLPLRLQARLLDFLQSRTLFPLGSHQEVRLNVRVIAATHRNLAQMVEEGRFREDLFHRLRVVTISMKSLMARADEFDRILHTCLKEVCELLEKNILRLSPAMADRLEEYSWPGNIRELRNVLEYAVLASEGEEIGVEHLPNWFLGPIAQVAGGRFPEATLGVADIPFFLDFNRSLETFEKEYFSRALSKNGGRINKTARQIGMNKTTLLRRIRSYQIRI